MQLFERKQATGSWRLPSLIAAGAAALVSLVMLAPQGCTAIVDTSAAQCSTDDDCRAMGADFAGSFCSQQKTCVRAVDYCATNLECIQRTGVPQTVCRKDTNTCVSLLTPQCTQVFAEPSDLEDDNVVLFGIHGAGSWSPVLQGATNAVELVRQDFRGTQGGLPATPATQGKPRPVAWISCDVPIGQQGLHTAVSDHLFKTVGVVGSLGPFATVEMTSYGLQSAIASNSLMTTFAEDQEAFDLPGKVGTWFSYGFPPGVVVLGQVQGVALLESLIRARGIDRPLRLSYVYVQGINSRDAELFYEQVRFNGKSAQENGPAYFQQLNYLPPSDPTFQASLAKVASAAKSFEPDIVVFRGSDEVATIAGLIETAFPGVAHYLLPVEGRVTAPQFVAGKEHLRRRTLGFMPGKYDQAPEIVAQDLRYNSAFPETGVGPGQHAAYDLAYTMYYAAAAVGDAPLTGRAMGEAIFKRFTADGVPVDMSPTSILKAFSALQAGKNLFVEGYMQLGLWDPNSGNNLDWKIQYWCVAPPSIATASPPDPRVQQGILQLNIESSAANPNLSGQIVADGQPLTALPQGCLSAE